MAGENSTTEPTMLDRHRENSVFVKSVISTCSLFLLPLNGLATKYFSWGMIFDITMQNLALTLLIPNRIYQMSSG